MDGHQGPMRSADMTEATCQGARKATDRPASGAATLLMIDVTVVGGVCVVRLSGALSGRTAGLLMDALTALVVGQNRNLVVQMAGVVHATRAGLRGLVVAAKLLSVCRRQMRICDAPEAAANLLHGLGLAHLIVLDDSLQDSLINLADTPGERGPK